MSIEAIEHAIAACTAGSQKIDGYKRSVGDEVGYQEEIVSAGVRFLALSGVMEHIRSLQEVLRAGDFPDAGFVFGTGEEQIIDEALTSRSYHLMRNGQVEAILGWRERSEDGVMRCDGIAVVARVPTREILVLGEQTYGFYYGDGLVSAEGQSRLALAVAEAYLHPFRYCLDPIGK